MIGLVQLILVIAVIGFICYLIITYIPMPDPFKQVIVVIIVIILLLYVLSMISSGNSFHLLR